MKRTIPLFLMILILVLTVAGPIMGCSPGEDNPGNPDSLQKERFLEIMSAININTVDDIGTWGLILVDIQASLSLDKRLGIETTSNNGGLVNEFYNELCIAVGIKPQDLASYAIIYPNLPYFLLGEFNLDDTRSHLSEMDFQRDDREGIEVWWSDYDAWVVLYGNLIIFGEDSYHDQSSEWCIRALTGEDKSLDEDPYFSNIIYDFPSVVSYSFYPVNQQYDEDCKLSADLMVVQGEIVKYMMVGVYTDSAAAMRTIERYGDDIREAAEELGESAGPDVKTEWYQSNQYIVIVAEVGFDQYRSLMAP
ncbi:MAG: hypothetical protein JSW38_02525 [Dehalococcoidia bacterium]|nr:MAG: hypothetical protein JSW38_02525 [Dehalococcoidia bacterium]